MFKILIPEETPSLNKGEAAILAGIIESLNQLPQEYKLSMFSLEPEIDQRSYPSVKIINAQGILPTCVMVKTRGALLKVLDYLVFLIKHTSFLFMWLILGHHVTYVMRRDVWIEYIQSDIILMAHDSAFAPVYHSFLIMLFRIMHKRIVIYGASFPAIKKMSSRKKTAIYTWLLRRALSLSDLITVRESMSYEYLHEIAISGPRIHLTADFAFLMKPAQKSRIDEIFNEEMLPKDIPIIGMTVSRNKVRRAYEKEMIYRERESRFVSEMATVVDHMISRFGALVVFIPHSIVEDPDRDDRILSRLVRDHVTKQDMVRVLERDFAAPDLKGLVGRFSMCLGSRLHFIIDSISMMVPSIAITDQTDQRVHGIIGDMAQMHDWVINVEELSSEQLVAITDKAWKERVRLKQHLQNIIPVIVKKTEQNGILLNQLLSRQTSTKGETH